MEHRRVVATGVGMITPLGTGMQKTWTALCAGQSGVGPLTRFDASRYPTRIAAEVRDFEPLDFVDKKDLKKMDRFIQFAIGASQMALDDAGLKIDSDKRERSGVWIGSAFAGIGSIQAYQQVLMDQGPDRITPFFIPMVAANLASGQVAIRAGFRGVCSATAAACTSGLHSIGQAFRRIQQGEADVMLAGGSDAAITPLTVAGFCAARALSQRNEEPQRASRPFDRGRDGFVIAEGAAVIVLEEMGIAVRRDARIYGEICGFGMSADAFHITAPNPDGAGAARCMGAALSDAGISAMDVDYVVPHATATAADRIETMALKSVFGEHAYRLPISGTKSMTGHLMGAAGAAEMAFALLSMRNRILPPTINCEEPDSQCDLDYVPMRARQASVRTILINAFGFGGVNGSAVVQSWPPPCAN